MSPEASAAEAALRLAACFDDDGLPYALGGALALGAWGVPRATADVDVAVFVGEAALDRLFDALERAGVLFARDEARRSAARFGAIWARLGRTGVDVFIAHHPLHREMERRRVELPTPDGRSLWFLSAEDVAVTKLIYGRPKDVLDLERLFAVQQGRLDLAYVSLWLARIVPPEDPRLALLEDLRRRFATG
ncbi:MAG TPA: hypothetical protein VGQ83_08785 [Polyangia bacterium]|jgi:hypothetical protein